MLTFALGGTAKLPPRAPSEQVKLDPPAQFADAETVAEGAAHFAHSCLYCHGGGAKGTGIIPDLRHSPLLGSREGWAQVVDGGVLSDRGMVSFHAAYSPAEIEAIRAYVIDRALLEERQANR